MVQLWLKGPSVAQHPRSTHEYKHTTNPLHMPERHRRGRRRKKPGRAGMPVTGNRPV
ncbi:hypothetical protein NJ45_004990 [Salmonella enterica subsp. enterica]|nr:hypothetical protein [Salmonella enterica subsp. enterica]